MRVPEGQEYWMLTGMSGTRGLIFSTRRSVPAVRVTEGFSMLAATRHPLPKERA